MNEATKKEITALAVSYTNQTANLFTGIEANKAKIEQAKKDIELWESEIKEINEVSFDKNIDLINQLLEDIGQKEELTKEKLKEMWDEAKSKQSVPLTQVEDEANVECTQKNN